MKISREAIIISSIALVFLIIIGVLVAKSSSFVAPPAVSGEKAALLVKSDSHMTGSSTAKVTMVEFGDFQCPACGAAFPIIKQVTDSYQNNPNFNFVFRHFPLSQHQYAKVSAEAAEAAGAQGKFWPMYEMLYQNQAQWDPNVTKDPITIFKGFAKDLGLNVEKFQQEVTNNTYQDHISADLADANRLGLNHTPTVFINGEEVDNNLTVSALKAKIDSLLNK